VVRAVLILTVLLGVVGAADERWPQMYDMRVFAGAATPLGSTNTTRFDDAFGYGWGTQGVIRRRLGGSFGALVLVGVNVYQHAGERSGASTVTGSEYKAACGEIGIGIFWQSTARIHVELVPSFRFGRGKVTIESDTGTDIGESDIYRAWSGSLGGFYTWPQGLQLGLTAGWSDWIGDSDLDGVNIRASGAGPQATAVIGYSF